jgi:hypothetical protein
MLNWYLTSSSVTVYLKESVFAVKDTPAESCFSNEVTSDVSLEHRDDRAKTLITHIFQVTEDSSFEEDFGVSKFVFCWIKLKSQQNLYNTQKRTLLEAHDYSTELYEGLYCYMFCSLTLFCNFVPFYVEPAKKKYSD